MRSADFLIGLIVVVAMVGGRYLSPRTNVPYAVYLVVIGASASFIPGVPQAQLDPNIVFLVFLPPLVYRAGFVTSPRELRENATAIGLSALGLVLVTTFAVAAAARLSVPSFGWAAAVVLGACVAPTDPVSATTVISRLGAPHRIVTILEGEGLVNDGIALTLLGVGITAVGSTATATSTLIDFVKVAAGGAAFGLATGFVTARIRRPTQDARAELVISLTVPYAAYIGAHVLGLSGVLSAVVAGLYIGQAAGAGSGAAARLQSETFWELMTFLLESGLFVLLGLQFRAVIDAITRYPTVTVAGVAAASVGAVVVTRMVWQMLIPTLRWRPEGRLLDTGKIPRNERMVLGWAGLRGVISLAAALSVPLMVNGRPFPDRDLLLFATFCVIIVTLVGQGATLSWIIERTGTAASVEERQQGLRARKRALQAALTRLDELAEHEDLPEDTVELLRSVYEQRLQRATAGLENQKSAEDPPVRHIQRELLRAQRQAVRKLHQNGEIDYAVLREAMRNIDLETESSARR